MLNSFKSLSYNLLTRLLSWKTNRKLLIFESDDWGALRISSRSSLNRLAVSGIIKEDDFFDKFDALESSVDFYALFDVLKKYRDKNGQHACITANTVMTNPDFEQIADRRYSEYSFVDLNTSYLRYSDGKSVINAFGEGIESGFLFPQFHGREHLNVPLWLDALKAGDKNLIEAFGHHTFCVRASNLIKSKKNVTGAFDSINQEHLNYYQNAVSQGLELFLKQFGFASKTMIAPSYIWGRDVEKAANENGILAFQGLPYQFLPGPQGKFRKKMHFLGQRNKFGQYYLVRNAFFEPALSNHPNDTADQCFKRIVSAIGSGIPAIVGTHRLNFIGTMNKMNRDRNLKLLDELLSSIIRKYPDIEFVNSSQLVELMMQKN